MNNKESFWMPKKEIGSEDRFRIFLDMLQKEYFNTLNRIEEVYSWRDEAEEDETKKSSSVMIKKEATERVVADLEQRLNFDLSGSLEYIDSRIPDLAERVNALLREQGLKLDKNDPSLEDVLRNSLIVGIGSVADWLDLKLLTTESRLVSLDDIGREAKIRNREEIIEKKFATYWRAGSDMRNYFDRLCVKGDQRQRLEAELNNRSGYVGKFEDYFLSKASDSTEKWMPTGGSKVPFFRFFCDWEEGLIGSQMELEKQLDALDPLGAYLDKGKIKRDFVAGKMDK